MAFIKLHSSILDSSVWLEDDKTRIVWFTLMAMADQDGVVEASLPGLAHRARVPRGACERAMAIFMSPDADSRTPDQDGRRIEKVAGGWRLINYDPYRAKGSVDDAKTKAAARQQRWRNARNARVTPRNGDETVGDADNAIGEGEEEAEGDPDSVSQSGPLSSPPDPEPARSNGNATFGGLAPFRAPRRPVVGAVTIPFLSCFNRYPRQDAKQAAAQVWQEIAETYPGGEFALATAINARWDAGQLTRPPYFGPNGTRPFFEKYLAERRWEDPESAPDDVAASRPAETFAQKDARANREAGERRVTQKADLDRLAREAEAAARKKLAAMGGGA